MKTKLPSFQLLIQSAAAVLLTVSFSGDAQPPESSLSTLQGRLHDFVEPRTASGEALFDLQMNLLEQERMNLLSGSSQDSIWSGDYWPLRFGALSAEYKDKGGYRTGLLGRLSWKKVKKRFDKNWRKRNPERLDPSVVADLSPAEKLDLLVSDYDLTFSKTVWESVAERYKRRGRIKMWEGYCHGWSTAAIQAPRPTKVVRVKSLDGRYEIPFTPHDLKGLATYLWSQSLIQDYVRVAGKRCNNKRRNFDPLTGMSDDESCNGVDPALFHLSLVHLMGMNRESFVINKNNSTQVWNQPIHSYSMKFFNLSTGRNGSVAKSIIRASSLQNDIRSKDRAPETAYLVGVVLKLKYVKETLPNRKPIDSEAHDRIKKLEYIYDLELDADHNIIGGQWRNFRTDDQAISAAEEDRLDFPGYPGFIWKIQRSEKSALSVASDGVTWDVGQPLPADVLERHRTAAAFKYKLWKADSEGNLITDENGKFIPESELLQPQPLSVIVHGLLRAARDPSDRRTLAPATLSE